MSSVISRFAAACILVWWAGFSQAAHNEAAAGETGPSAASEMHQDAGCEALENLSKSMQDRSLQLPRQTAKVAKDGEIRLTGPTIDRSCRKLVAEVFLSMDIHTVYPFEPEESHREKYYEIYKRKPESDEAQAKKYADDHVRQHKAVQEAGEAIVRWLEQTLQEVRSGSELRVFVDFQGRSDGTKLAPLEDLQVVKRDVPTENLSSGEKVNNSIIAILRRDEFIRRVEGLEIGETGKTLEESSKIGPAYRGVRIRITIERDRSKGFIIEKIGPSYAWQGREFDYTISYLAQTTSSLVIRDQLEDGLRYVGANPPPHQEGQDLQWTVRPGDPSRIVLRVISDRPGKVENCASLSLQDRQVARDCATTAILTADLKKAASVSRLHVGEAVTYTIRARIPAEISSSRQVFKVADSLPQKLRFLSAEPPPHRQEGNLLEWSLGPSNDQTISVTTRAVDAGRIENCALLRLNEEALKESCDEIEAVFAVSELTLKKTGPDEPIYWGEEAAFDLLVRNESSSVPVRFVLRDPLPEGLTFLSSAPPSEKVGRESRWEFSLEPSRESRVTLKVQPEHPGKFRNCAFAEIEGQEGESKKSCAELEVVARPLEPEFSPIEGPCGPGSFTLAIHNPNPHTLGNAALEIRFPPGLETLDGSRVLRENGLSIGPDETLRREIGYKARLAGELQVQLSVSLEGHEIQRSIPALIHGPVVTIERVHPQPIVLRPGQAADLEVRISNTSDVRASELVVRLEELPPGFVSLKPNPDTSLQELAAGASFIRAFRIEAVDPAPGDHKLRIQATALCAKDVLQSALIVVKAGIAEPDIRLRQVNSSVHAGGSASYEVELVNQGEEADRQVIVEVELPDSLQFRTSDLSSLEVSQRDAHQVLTARFSELLPQAPIVFHFEAEARDSGSFPVTATIRSATLEPPLVAKKTVVTQILPRSPH